MRKPLLLSLPVNEWMDEWIRTSTHATGNSAHAHPTKRRRAREREKTHSHKKSLATNKQFNVVIVVLSLSFDSLASFSFLLVCLFVCLLSQCVSVLLLANWMMYTQLALFFSRCCNQRNLNPWILNHLPVRWKPRRRIFISIFLVRNATHSLAVGLILFYLWFDFLIESKASLSIYF